MKKRQIYNKGKGSEIWGCAEVRGAKINKGLKFKGAQIFIGISYLGNLHKKEYLHQGVWCYYVAMTKDTLFR